MKRNCIAPRHVYEHVAEPIVGHGAQEIRLDPKLRTAESCSDGIPPE